AGSRHLQWPIGHKSLRTLKLVRPLRRLLIREGVDILHVRSRLPAWIAWLAWRSMEPATRPRFITTVHGLYSVGRYSAIMTRGERVIAVSETVRDYILDNYPGMEPGRIRVIYRGVDPEDFPRGYQPGPAWCAAWREQYPRLAGKRILTLPGRLTRLKGHNDFIELVARLHEQGEPVHGLIVGGEDPRRHAYAEELQKNVHARGLDSHITFTGPRSDMSAIYAVADLVLSLSGKPESFGRTVLEALSLGVPVIGYDHGGVGEILRKIYPAGMVPVGDVDGLKDRVKTLLESPGSIGGTGCFSLHRMLDATLQLYREVLQ
ncbi:MAG: glycosyltransferase, partial [Gammaproteobacteria bacterium]|nr:glycosyltransferase [Gammaproteobacteria bacterium]